VTYTIGIIHAPTNDKLTIIVDPIISHKWLFNPVQEELNLRRFSQSQRNRKTNRPIIKSATQQNNYTVYFIAISMPWDSLAYLLALLLAGLITPGPNNITCTVHAVVHGKKSNLPLIAGMALGFSSIHFICGMAVDSFDEDGTVRTVMDIIGSLFMFLIAFGILYLGRSEKIQNFPEVVPKLGFKTGVLMQYVNGKEWAMVFMLMTKFLDDFGGGVVGILTITSITTSGGILAMLVWSNLGEKIKSKTDEPKFLKKAFTVLGSLLFILATIISIRGL